MNHPWGRWGLGLGFVALNLILGGWLLPQESARLHGAIISFVMHRQASAIDRVRETVPTAVQLATLSAELPALARRHGLTLPSIHYEPVQPVAGRYAKLTMTLPVHGPYQAVRRFLHALETHSALMTIEQLILRSGGGGDVAADLRVSTYLRASGEGR